MGGHVANVGEKTDAFSILVGITEEEDHLEKPGVDGRTDIQEVGWGGINWIDQAQDRDRWRSLANAVMNLQLTQN
jgi:hypothetical protein